MKKLSTRNVVFAELFIALGILLPFFTGQIPSIGKKLLPMHIPVLLSGFVCGWPYGLVVGFILPVLRSMFFGMPIMFPAAIAMAFELATYGLMSGILSNILPKKNIFIYVSLIVSMIFGRVVWGIASILLYRMAGAPFTWKIFMSGAFINAVPGIIVQLIIIPIIITSLGKARAFENVQYGQI